MNLLILLPFIISFLIGFSIYQNLTLLSDHKNKFFMGLIFSFGLGLAVSSFLTFTSFIIFNHFYKNYIISINLIALGASLGCFIYRLIKHKKPFMTLPQFSLLDAFLVILLLVLMIPALYWGSFFLNGGWDAWSTWNLKARILFLGGENWKNIFNPILWRASPHYPLLLPLINVWGWSFQYEPSPLTPLITSAIYMLLTVSLLYAGLKYLISSRWAFICVVLLMLHSYYMKIAMSQYCDIVLSFYLLAGLISLIISKREDNKIYALVAGLNFGILTFTKPEGMVAAGILALLSLVYFFNPQARNFREKIFSWLYVMYGFLIGVIPTFIFQIFYAPENQTMINGLLSKDHPSTWERLDTIWKFYLMEMLGDFSLWKGVLIGSWHGIWLVLVIGFVIALFRKGRCFDPLIRIIPMFIACYMAVITFYYFVNTYFPIAWWMQVTLHRIYFSLLPVILCWIFYSVWKQDKK